MSENVYDRILGCMAGNALGDAFGAVVESCSADRAEKLAGQQWVDQFLPFPDDFGTHPVGVWQEAPLERASGSVEEEDAERDVASDLHESGELPGIDEGIALSGSHSETRPHEQLHLVQQIEEPDAERHLGWDQTHHAQEFEHHRAMDRRQCAPWQSHASEHANDRYSI
jgi:hypothetical protein